LGGQSRSVHVRVHSLGRSQASHEQYMYVVFFLYMSMYTVTLYAVVVFLVVVFLPCILLISS
jgi:hypothetical protein